VFVSSPERYIDRLTELLMGTVPVKREALTIAVIKGSKTLVREVSIRFNTHLYVDA